MPPERAVCCRSAHAVRWRIYRAARTNFAWSVLPNVIVPHAPRGNAFRDALRHTSASRLFFQVGRTWAVSSNIP
ncbi:DUF1534 domain-containing protein [Pseudomonas caricapapayae]|nr:DUF1534 domain-containing protein [Pseudomonas caricapapayae]